MDAAPSHQPGPSTLPSMSLQSIYPPESDHTELYYSDLEEDGDDEAHARTRFEQEESTADEEYEELRSKEKRSSGGAFGDRKGKGVAFTDAAHNLPHIDHGRPSKEKEKGRSWYDLDLSLIVALVSPIGNWLTGSDHIKNLFLILILIFYLHQLIETPWQLYHASRPRKPVKHVPRKNDSHQVSLAHLAHTELHKQEIFYLFLAVIAPLLGAVLIRYVLTSLEGVDNLSWFSTTLFVLATGIRPWSHLIGRLEERTHELHDTVHYPSEQSDARHQLEIDHTLQGILKRLSALDQAIQDLEEKTDKVESLREVCDDLSEAVGTIERNIGRNERKTETTRVTQDTRINLLETGLVEMEARRRHDRETIENKLRLSPYTRIYDASQPHFSSFFSNIFSVTNKLGSRIAPYFGSFLPRTRDSSVKANGTIYLTPRRLPTIDDNTTTHYLTRLETIPEAEDSDSDGTYVSDKDTSMTTPSKKLGTPPLNESKSRSRSVSSGRKKCARDQSPPSKVMEYAVDLVAWPYRSAVRVLVMISPPVQKLFW